MEQIENKFTFIRQERIEFYKREKSQTGTNGDRTLQGHRIKQ